jgi:hypothetical protein
MQPEISRRCLGCGAAVRAGARFCPQCGRQMEADTGADAPQAVTDDARAAPDAGPARESAPPTKEFSAFVGSPEGRAVQSSEDGARAALRETRETTAEAQAAGAREVEAPAAEVPTPERWEVEAPAVETTAVETPSVKTRVVETSAVETAVEHPAVETQAAGVGADADGVASGEEARGRVARVREGARERVGVARERVGRMKDDALVALEEPADDSGLRFVLTAAALFVVFLVILLLSTTILR